jgi:hypothetical protein
MSDFLSGAHTQTTTKAGFPTGADSFFLFFFFFFFSVGKFGKNKNKKSLAITSRVRRRRHCSTLYTDVRVGRIGAPVDVSKSLFSFGINLTQRKEERRKSFDDRKFKFMKGGKKS